MPTGFPERKRGVWTEPIVRLPDAAFPGQGSLEKSGFFNILNDDAFSSPERCAAGALTQMSSVPEVKPPRRETPMSFDFKVRRFRIQELNIAKVGTGKGNGDVDNLAQDRLQPGFADGEHGQFVQHGQGLQFLSRCQFACQCPVDGLVYASASFFGHGIPTRGTGFKD
jgi:hypothetical protein